MIIGADSTQRDEENPFWTFSVSLYEQPGVAAACIALQDEAGLDVNLLLYACFAAAQGVALGVDDAAALAQQCADWRHDVVAPLRALRRSLACRGDADEVATQLLAVELTAERQQQDLIWIWHRARPCLSTPDARAAQVESNLLATAEAAAVADAGVLLAPLLAVLARVSMPEG